MFVPVESVGVHCPVKLYSMKNCPAILPVYFPCGFSKAQDFRFGLTAAPLISWFNVDGTDVENDGTRLLPVRFVV